MRNILFWPLGVLMFLCLGSSTVAQKYYESPYRFGKITEEDFEIESEIISEDDAAVVMCDIGSSELTYGMRGEGVLEKKRFIRIKILAKDGLSQGDRSIFLEIGDTDAQKIYQLKAKVHNVVDGKIETSSLKSKDWKEERYSDKLNVVRFSLPNVRVGSIIEISYSIKDPFWFKVDDWLFQTDIPTLYSAYYVYHPDEIGYKLVKMGYYELTDTDKGDEYVSSSRTTGVSGGQYRRFYYKFVCENIPAWKDLNFLDDPENYKPRIIGELSYYQNKNGQIKEVYSDWNQAVNKFLNESSVSSFLEIKKKSFAIDIPGDVQDSLSRALYLYEYIKNSIESSDPYSGFYPQKSPASIAAIQRASKNEINWLLIYALRAQGIEAHPVLATSRNQPRVVEMFPIISQFSRILAAVFVSGEFYLVDASDPYMTFGQLPAALQNGSGLLALENNARWIDLKSRQPSQSITMIQFSEVSDGQIKGKAQVRRSGVYLEQLRSLTKMQESELIESLDLPDEWTTSISACSGLEAKSDLLQLELDLNVPLEKLGDSYFLPAVMFDEISENPFMEEERLYPVSYICSWEKSYTCMIELPEGWTFSSTPENAAFALPGGLATFRFSASPVGNQLVLSSKIRIQDDYFQREQYSALRELYDLIATSHNSLIEIKEL